MTVKQLLANISSIEISEWMAYARIEPFGEKRADLRAASIAQAVLMPHIKKGKKKPSLADCCLTFGRPKQMSMKDIENFFKSLTKKMGGTIDGEA